MGILGTVGIADKENYNPSETYVIGNSVYYEGSTWVARKNNLTGITPEEGENWKYLARGFGSDNLSQIEARDSLGLMGIPGANVVSQDLIDAISMRVIAQLIPYTNIANNFLATDPKTVLSGPMGKALKDQLDTTNSNLALKASQSDLNNTNTNLANKASLKITEIATGDTNHTMTFGFFSQSGKIYINVYIDGTVFGQIQPIP